MVKIYCITDCNGLHYVGSTTQALSQRLSKHRSDKKIGHYCSSSKLNLDDCQIDLLEQCELCDRSKRERFYINVIDCVNEYKLNFDREQWSEDNKEKVAQYKKQWREDNKEKIAQTNKQWYHYKNSWGGDKRSNNNILEIDVNLFK